jgi:hypothetical protein
MRNSRPKSTTEDAEDTKAIGVLNKLLLEERHRQVMPITEIYFFSVTSVSSVVQIHKVKR